MKIGVISDTHNRAERMEKAFQAMEERGVEIICHLGDWVAPYMLDLAGELARRMNVPVKAVLGNNDREVFEMAQSGAGRWGIDLGLQTLSFKPDDSRIALYHGTDPSVTEALVRSGMYDAVFTGHSHVPKKEMIGNTLWLNPGTVSGIKRGERALVYVELAIYDSSTREAELIQIN